MVLVVDNYDSFTYNLVQLIRKLGREVRVFRNDAIAVDQAVRLEPDHVVISPGPCSPEEAGISVPLIRALAPSVPILGVCLGHQSIGAAFGGTIARAGRPMHGKTSRIEHDGRGVFSGLPANFTATRYHSLVIRRDSVPDCLEVSARAEDGEIMGVRHRSYPVEGVQFHPEAVLSEHGEALLTNFLTLQGASAQ